MLIQHKSSLNYDETVATLSEAINNKPNWKVLSVSDFQENVQQAGHGNIERTGSVPLCNPLYAARILSDESNRKVTAFMPLNIGVYEDAKGEVYVSELNVGMMGMMFGGTIAEVMADAGKDIKDVISSVNNE